MTRICDKLIEAGIFLLLVLTPIYYGSVDLVMVAVIEGTILFMLLVWGVGMVCRGEFVLRRTPLNVPILLFCTYSVVSTLFFSKYKHISYSGLIFVLCISALYFIIVNCIRSKKQLIRLLAMVLLVGFLHAFSHLMQSATGAFGPRISGMLSVGNHFAGYMVIIIPLAVAMIFVVKDTGKRVLLAFAGIVMVSAMAFSLVAGAMLTFLLSLIFIALLLIRSGGSRKLPVSLIGLVLCSILLIISFGHTPVLNELLTVTNLDTGSPAGRLLLWKSSLAIFANSPIIGTGLGTFDYIFPKYRLPEVYGKPVYAHSDWLQLMTELGAIGLVIVLLGVALFFLSVFRNSRAAGMTNNWRKGLVIGGLSSVGAGIVHALVDFNLHIPAIAVLFTIIIAMTVAASMYRRHSKSEIRSIVPEWKIRASIPIRVASAIFLILATGSLATLILRPCIADSYHHRGTELEMSLYWDEAAEKYRAASEVSLDNGDYFYALGNVYAKRVTMNKETGLQEKWYKLAADAYTQAIDICPMNGDYHLVFGNLHEVVGNIEEARYEYLRSISLDPNNAFYHRTYGTFCLRQGDAEKAASEYRKALEVYPADLHDILSECYTVLDAQSDDPDFHIRHFVSNVCPQDVDAYTTAARFLAGKELYEAAFSEYRNAIAMAPGETRARRELSNLLVIRGEFVIAEAIWQQFLELHPNNAEAHAQLASVYVKQKRLEDAVQEYLAAANMEQNSSHYYTRAADLYMQQGEVDEAVKLWQKAIKQDPHTADAAYYRLGRHHEDQGNWFDALSFFQQAIVAAPKKAGYRMHLAKSYCKRELFYESIQEWKNILKLRPEDVFIHLQLAKIYSKIESQEKAKEHYRQILRIQPENTEAQKGLLAIEGAV